MSQKTQASFFQSIIILYIVNRRSSLSMKNFISADFLTCISVWSLYSCKEVKFNCYTNPDVVVNEAYNQANDFIYFTSQFEKLYNEW